MDKLSVQDQETDYLSCGVFNLLENKRNKKKKNLIIFFFFLFFKGHLNVPLILFSFFLHSGIKKKIYF